MLPDPYTRRQFLGFLAASPVIAATGLDHASLERLLNGTGRDRARLLDFAQQAAAPAAQQPGVITAASQAFNVFDFEPAAKAKAPPAHWGYLATGTDDDGTIRANREGFGASSTSAGSTLPSRCWV